VREEKERVVNVCAWSSKIRGVAFLPGRCPIEPKARFLIETV